MHTNQAKNNCRIQTKERTLEILRAQTDIWLDDLRNDLQVPSVGRLGSKKSPFSSLVSLLFSLNIGKCSCLPNRSHLILWQEPRHGLDSVVQVVAEL